jgi:hypothetical protein
MIGSSFEYPIFFNKNFSQATSHATSAKDLYSTYVVDYAIIGCNLLQGWGYSKHEQQTPVVNFVLSRSQAQLASTYPIIIVSTVGGKKMSLLLVPF